MIPFIISTHVAYLNTPVHIRSNVDYEIVVNCNSLGPITLLPKESKQLDIYDNPGEIVFEYDGYIEKLIVEDAYKFGGSKVKQTYISEKSTWCIIEMNDRTYFYNRMTQDEYVEYNFVPERIAFVGEECILASSESQHTLFSMKNRQPVDMWQGNMLTHSEWHVVIQKEDFIRIYNLCSGELEQEYRYSHYFIDGNEISLFDKDVVTHINLKNILVESSETSIKNEFWGFLSIDRFVIGHQDQDVSFFEIWNAKTCRMVYRIDYKGKIASLNNYTIIDSISLRSAWNEIPSLILSNNFVWEYYNIAIYCLEDIVYVRWDKYSCSTRYWNKFEESFITNSKTSDHISCQRYDKLFIDNDYLYLINDSVDKEESKIYAFSVKGDCNIVKSRFDSVEILESDYKQSSKVLIIKENSQQNYYHPFLGKLNLHSPSSLYKLGEHIKTDWSFYKRFGSYVEQYRIASEVHKDRGDISCVGYPFSNDGRLVEICDGASLAVSANNSIKLGPLFFDRPINALRDNIIGISQNHNLCLIKSASGIVLASWDETSKCYIYEDILVNTFDNHFLSDAYLHPDNHSVVYKDKDGNWWLHDYFLDTKTQFANNVLVKHCNGYRPIVKEDSYRRLTFIDPVTNNPIAPENYGKFDFVSPDGKYMAENKRHYEYKSKINGEVIDESRYDDFRALYGFRYGYAKDPIICNRKKFLKENSVYFAHSLREHKFKKCSLVINKEIKIFCERNDYEYEPKEAERRELYAELKNILESDSFVENLFEKYEWVKIVESDTSKEIRLMLGAPLWFINYISFSNDNRYVGITGKYRDSSGVYFLFDLTSEELVYKHIDDNGTSRILAVWSCAFTKNNITGYYTSAPHCYLIDFSATEIQPKRISNKSFLCFSPSGEYMALSNKGYIPYSSSKIGWGHQPSNDIYVHRVNEPETELAHFKDHGDGIKGITSNKVNCPKDIGMVSFSMDNTKLLSVSYDGVVVVRNLRFIDNEQINNSVEDYMIDKQ